MWIYNKKYPDSISEILFWSDASQIHVSSETVIMTDTIFVPWEAGAQSDAEGMDKRVHKGMT